MLIGSMLEAVQPAAAGETPAQIQPVLAPQGRRHTHVCVRSADSLVTAKHELVSLKVPEIRSLQKDDILSNCVPAHS